jgi:hypothetical protein
MSELDEVTKLVRTRLLGESLRECGVLVLIFAPLDILLEARGTIDWRQLCLGSFCMSWRNVALVFFAVAEIFLLYFGIKIESEAELVLKEIQERGGQNAISDASI